MPAFPHLAAIVTAATAACAAPLMLSKDPATLLPPRDPPLSCTLHLTEHRGQITARAEIRAREAASGAWMLEIARATGPNRVQMKHDGQFALPDGGRLSPFEAQLPGPRTGLRAEMHLRHEGARLACPQHWGKP